ncbi:hypothetical protein EVAR_83140_1 [Eumeta japonica]|uniref:Uncharacterized protein n=1 Tax=Eumeta variegata TaxID=151549 RepID=A0A4C1YC49_EUMVA|nr:hypothetical protein EVAR_83140_1 [Eumeta japonica]
MTAGARWFVKNDVIARDLKVETLKKFIKMLARRTFNRVDVDPYTSLYNLAPQCERPPRRYQLPRDQLSKLLNRDKVEVNGHLLGDGSRHIMTRESSVPPEMTHLHP